MTGTFDLINDISHGKKNLIRSLDPSLNAETKIYNSWLTNKNFSLFPDTILYANEMNRYPNIPNIMQHDYYLNTLRSKKRFAKWPKKVDHDDIDLVCRYYGVNKVLAETYLELMSEDDMKIIRSKFETGGIKNDKKRTT